MEKNEQENIKTLKYFQSMQLSQKNSNNLFCVQKWITVIEMASGFVVFILSDGRHSHRLWLAGALSCTAGLLWTELSMRPDSHQLMANDVLTDKGTVQNYTFSGQMCKACYI